MSTPNRTEINQANAQHSTGPKTEAGKQRSALNALSHGLTGQLIVMPNEDRELYESHKKSLVDEYHPKGATEALLVQALADVSWRLNRVAALETNLLTLTACPMDQSRALANLSLHSQRLSRQFEKTLSQLRELQRPRRAQERHDLDALLEITDMYEERGETYNPKEDGFVFTQSQVNQAILARNRDRLLEEAYEAAA
jgi:hypothetical protein